MRTRNNALHKSGLRSPGCQKCLRRVPQGWKAGASRSPRILLVLVPLEEDEEEVLHEVRQPRTAPRDGGLDKENPFREEAERLVVLLEDCVEVFRQELAPCQEFAPSLGRFILASVSVGLLTQCKSLHRKL